VELLAILFGAGFTVAVCVALGRLILREACEDPGARFVAGAAALSLLVFVLCVMHLAYPMVFLGLGAVAITWGRPAIRLPRAWKWPVALFAPFFVLYFCHAMAPEASPDGAGYHLSLVARYLHAHGFVRITDNFYAAFPGAVEMLFLHAFAFGRHSAAALVHLAFLVALTWQIYAFARRAGYPQVGFAAALLVFASPVVGIDAASAYNDVALAAIAFTLFHLLEVWSSSHHPRLAVANGLLAGFAVATKLTAWLAVPWAVLWIARKSRLAAAVAAVLAAVGIAPWLIKNWVWLDNPVAPFFNRVFPNPYVLASFEDGYRRTMALYHLQSRWEIPWDVTTRGTLSGLLGPMFLLAPVALLALRTSLGRHVLLAALVFSANYFSNIGTRFLIAPLPFLTLAMALALAAVPRVAIGIALLHAVLSWPALIPKYASRYSWHLTRTPWREALRLKPEGPYIETRLPYYAIDHLIEEKTAPGATVFTYTPIPEAYTSRHIRVEFQAAENKMTGAILWTACQPEYAPIWRLRWSFPRQPLGGVRVVQTGTGPDLWSVHELRVFDGTRELPRAPEWRLRADPYRWGVQSAFDNSPITFWLAGDTVRPDQFVEARFGREEMVDAVLIESAPNQPSIRPKLEGLNASGRWIPLAGEPVISDVPRPLGLRRAAAEEAKRRGNDYLLIFHDNVGAEDFRLNSDLWGTTFVGEAAGARLYELPK
jgi:hypothetical protein